MSYSSKTATRAERGVCCAGACPRAAEKPVTACNVLTVTGSHRSQAEQLGAHLRALPASLQPEVVVVSPLRRTLETAIGVFGGGPVLNGDAAAAELLMVAMEAVPQASGRAPAASDPTLRHLACSRRHIKCAVLMRAASAGLQMQTRLKHWARRNAP